MTIKKSQVGTIAGILIALVIGAGAVKFNPDAQPAPLPAPAVAPVIPDAAPSVVTPQVVDPNQAQVVFYAPAEVRIGQLVVIDVSASNASSFDWQVVPETQNFIVIDEGRRAVFSSETAGDYLFVVGAAKGETVDVASHRIRVGSGGAQPTANIASKVPDWCGKVQSPSKRDEALRLSQSFASVAAIVTPSMQASDIVAATVKSNRDALGSNIKNWEPFLAQLQVELEARVADGSLSNADSHIKAWREISQALAEYAKTVPVTTTGSTWRR